MKNTKGTSLYLTIWLQILLTYHLLFLLVNMVSGNERLTRKLTRYMKFTDVCAQTCKFESVLYGRVRYTNDTAPTWNSKKKSVSKK